MTTILIADDHDIIRVGLKNILKDQFDYKVVGEAVDGEDVRTKVEKLKPDILLLDISMPKVSGLDIAKGIRMISPKTNILIISVHKSPAYIIRALRAGVKGYLQKENAGEELLPALRKIVNGKTYLSESVSSYLVDRLTKKDREPVDKTAILSEREDEVLQLVGEGKTAKEIADILYISQRTVENYKNSILRKLGLHKTSELIKYAIKHKIVDIDEY